MFVIIRRFASFHTIYALSSGQGKCGVAVIRVSGPHTKSVLGSLTHFKIPPPPRTALLRSIRHPKNNELLDKGLVLWFPGPKSFTGEDCCEFHVHGGVAVVGAVMDALASLPGLQMARPGEFTRRAFYNQKLDLTEVEGLADLLQAETEVQRKQAVFQTQGALSQLYNRWRDNLLRTLAYLEADIDFSETETLEHNILSTVTDRVNKLIEELEAHFRDGRKGELLRQGVKTVILGAPNVGKSSLMNLLCQRPAAIVTPLAGTTRDLLEVTLNINGYPLVLTDTAGLRDNTEDIIEMEGVNRALNSYKNCDLVILVIDSADYRKTNISYKEYVDGYLKRLSISDFVKEDMTFAKNCIVVFNKSDLTEINNHVEGQGSWISCKTEVGLCGLIDAITAQLKTLCGEPSSEHPAMNQARHREHLSKCLEYLKDFHEQRDAVLQAEFLRLALRHLGYLVGSTTTEQLLDVIFKDFCIGK